MMVGAMVDYPPGGTGEVGYIRVDCQLLDAKSANADLARDREACLQPLRTSPIQ
jgi:hypothetical protein